MDKLLLKKAQIAAKIETLLDEGRKQEDAIVQQLAREYVEVEKQLKEQKSMLVKSFPLPSGDSGTFEPEPKGKRLIILDSGNKIHQAISVKENLSDLRGGGDKNFRPGSGGRILRACLTGNSEDLNTAEMKAFAEGTGSAGGFILPQIVSTNIIDMARNRAVLMSAGAYTLEMPQPEMTLV